jgi:hypothetical protein
MTRGVQFGLHPYIMWALNKETNDFRHSQITYYYDDQNKDRIRLAKASVSTQVTRSPY